MVKVARKGAHSAPDSASFASRRTQDICGLILFFVGISCLVCLVMHRPDHPIPVWVNYGLRQIAGAGAFVIPILFMFIGTMFLIGYEYLSFSHTSLGSLLLFIDFITWRHLEMVTDVGRGNLASAAATDLMWKRIHEAGGWGGWLFGAPLHYLCGQPLSNIFLIAILTISMVLIVDRPVVEIIGRLRSAFGTGMARSRAHAEELQRLRDQEEAEKAVERQGDSLPTLAGGPRSATNTGGPSQEAVEQDRSRRASQLAEKALAPARNSRSETAPPLTSSLDLVSKRKTAERVQKAPNLFDLTRFWRETDDRETGSAEEAETEVARRGAEGGVDGGGLSGMPDGDGNPVEVANDPATGRRGNVSNSEGDGERGTRSATPRERIRKRPAAQLEMADANSVDASLGEVGDLVDTTVAVSALVPEFALPPLTLLAPAPPATKRAQAELTDNVSTIERTLEQFNIDAKIVEVASGPSVTRYEIQLGPGIKVSKIVNLADNLAMSLAAIDVRVEAPIPGKSAIGVEVPNASPVMVTLRECLETDEFKNAASRLTIALGKDVSGQYKYADLTRMPHLLIGGSTNSGKSVCLNVLIASLLYRNSPRDVRLLMIDPKRVELSLWDGIPHLMHPVVKDVKQAAGIFRAALREMDRRYDLFATLGTRNIDGFNQRVPETERLPYVVLIVDELADLMMQQGPEVEQSICRLAQLARATGIHLVLATQRPSVDIITGTIKANISSRIAFAVASQVDSRTILDMTGADRLIGRGDMLFLPIDASKPNRIQGCYLSENETNAIVEFLKQQEKPVFTFSVAEGSHSTGASGSGGMGEEEEGDDGNDQFFEQAVRLVVNNGQASTSMLQRRFRIGYTRAARIVEMMEERGIVGPLNGAKPRELLVSRDDVERMFNPGGSPPSVDEYEDEG